MPTPTVRSPAAAPLPSPVASVPPVPQLARHVLFLAWPVLALNSLILLVDLSGFLSEEGTTTSLTIGTPPPHVPLLVRFREELKKVAAGK